MPANKSLATIWDMDGVIVDTALYHFRSWQYAFKKKGVNFTAADFQRKFGQRNDAIIRATIGREIKLDEIEEIALEKEEYFRKDVQESY